MTVMKKPNMYRRKHHIWAKYLESRFEKHLMNFRVRYGPDHMANII